jgi:hypothetical protein
MEVTVFGSYFCKVKNPNHVNDHGIIFTQNSYREEVYTEQAERTTISRLCSAKHAFCMDHMST